MWFLEEPAYGDTPSTLWGKHYFPCQICELGESWADEDVLCPQGLALRDQAIQAIPPADYAASVQGHYEYLTHLADEHADDDYRLGWAI